ncbi:MAG: hypothetical protein KF780_13955 [Sphingomonas sp.]|nr:hypothetical protein [Sphingomonas sp.]
MLNFRSVKIATSVALAASIAAIPASAQNFNAAPSYGTINLNGGFTPDPQVINMQSGGNIDAQRAISSSCRGFIANAPDVRLVYSPTSYPLIISVDSSADTTLVVNAPDGRWYCDDDGGERGLNPSVRFNRPMSGRYEIWVGTYGNASLQPARLYISEVTSQ